MKNQWPKSCSLEVQPTQEQIAAAAYHLYVARGCRDGDDLGDWLRAEELLLAAVPELFPEVEETVEEAVDEFWWTDPRISQPRPHALEPARSRKIEHRGTIRRPVEHAFA